MAIITYPTYVYGYKYTPIDVDLKTHFTNFTKNPTINENEWSVSGDGVFDDLMETGTKHLIAQHSGNRLRGEDYGNAYVQIYIATLQALIQQWTTLALESKRLEVQLAISREQNESAERQNTERLASQESIAAADRASREKLADRQLELQWRIALLQAGVQEKLIDKQVESEDAKKLLYLRQIESFDEDFKQKIFKIMNDGWSVAYSVDQDMTPGSLIIPNPVTKEGIDNFYNLAILPEVSNDPAVNDPSNTTSITTPPYTIPGEGTVYKP